MSERTLQPAEHRASLHAHASREPHVDSEEAVLRETRRVSRELAPIYKHDVAREESDARRAPQTNTSSRLRRTSLHNSNASQEHLQRHSSDASTQPDVPGASPIAARSTRSSFRTPRWYDSVTEFWRLHVSLTIEEGAHRDHLALERTFLGYLRTSLILAMTGVLTAQLFRLQHVENPNPEFGFYVIGRPLSGVFIAMAVFVVLVGAFRFWKLQQGLVRGKAYAGGWEILLVMGMSGLLLIGTFALVLGVNIEKAVEGE